MSDDPRPRQLSPLVSVPRDALAQLLQAAGSTQTPEEFVAALPEIAAHQKYAARASAAAWSKYVLYVVAAFALLCTVFSFDVENLIILIWLSIVAFFESRVHRGFQQGNPGAPDLGFRNQAGFAAGILVYGLYHAATVGSSTLLDQLNGSFDSPMLAAIELGMRGFYLLIGLVGGVSQFWLGWYYRGAKTSLQ
jgi:hypothetical protein